MHRLLAFIASLSLAMIAFAQDPVTTDADKYKVIFENDCVRVLDYKDRPGDKTHQHKHPAFVLYSLSAFKRSITLPDGNAAALQGRRCFVVRFASSYRPQLR